MQIGELAAWYFTDGLGAGDAQAFAQRLERWGYSALWIPEAVGRDPFAHAAWLLAGTQRLIVATGIASIYARDANAMAAAQKTVAEQSGGRFLLGLGVSHAPMVEGLRGHSYGPPVATMRAYLERMRAAPYMAPAPAEPPPIVLAALGPKMLALSAERTQGAHPYNVPPEHTALARRIMGPQAWICVEQKVVLDTNASRARATARAALQLYMALPNYANNWKRLGFTDADIAGGGSDKLMDALVAWGDEEALRRRVREHLDAGATQVCIQPLSPPGTRGPDLRAFEALAPVQGAG
jgi:probable F420-dependent oxidoreductase